jgi:hypothetical protein
VGIVGVSVLLFPTVLVAVFRLPFVACQFHLGEITYADGSSCRLRMARCIIIFLTSPSRVCGFRCLFHVSSPVCHAVWCCSSRCICVTLDVSLQFSFWGKKVALWACQSVCVFVGQLCLRVSLLQFWTGLLTLTKLYMNVMAWGLSRRLDVSKLCWLLCRNGGNY